MTEPSASHLPWCDPAWCDPASGTHRSAPIEIATGVTGTTFGAILTSHAHRDGTPDVARYVDTITRWAGDESDPADSTDGPTFTPAQAIAAGRVLIHLGQLGLDQPTTDTTEETS